MSGVRVRLVDGREVPFDKDRVREGVSRALDAAGDADAPFATEVADVVELTLERRLGGDARGRRRERVLSVDDVEDLVEQALVELGRSRVVREYILERARRASRRRSLEGARSESEPAPRAVRVTEAAGTSGWSRARIVGALMTEADLPRATAETVAARVEERVFSSGLARITTALIRELVDNELVDMGLQGALRRQGPVGVPRHDLRRLFDQRLSGRDVSTSGLGPEEVGAERVGARSVSGRVAGEVLRRFTLEDVVPAHVADLHLEGELSLEDAARPHLYLTQCVPCELLLRGALGTQSAFELLDEVARVAGATSRGVVLEAPGVALQPLIRGVRSDSASGLGAWLAALRALGRATGQRFDLVAPGARSGALIARLVEELARGADATGARDSAAPRLFLSPDEWSAGLEHTPRLGAAADRLLRAGLLVPTWSGGRERFTGPGCHRQRNEQGGLACGGAVALNLPRLARRAGPWREDKLLEELAHAVAAALDGLEALSEFQARHRAARSGEVRGRVAYALTPVGLSEALRYLGDGELRAEQGARVLGFLADAARRLAAERGLSVALSPFFGARAAARFASLDARRPRAEQGKLFGATLDGDAPALDRRYSCGFDLAPLLTTEPGAAEGRLLATVPTGALYPFPRLAREIAAAAETREPSAAAWERFQLTRSDLASRARSPQRSEPAPLFSEADPRGVLAAAGGRTIENQDGPHPSASPPERGGDPTPPCA